MRVNNKIVWIAVALVLIAALAVFVLCVGGMSKELYVRGAESQTDCQQAALEANYWVNIPLEDIVTECDLTAAKNGGITTISTVDEKVADYFFVVKVSTVVTGE